MCLHYVLSLNPYSFSLIYIVSSRACNPAGEYLNLQEAAVSPLSMSDLNELN